MYPLKINQVVIFSLLSHSKVKPESYLTETVVSPCLDSSKQVCHCQRRIVKGNIVTEPKKYVVYFAKSRVSPMAYDAWLCGGALVSSEYIVTSAACVEDVKHLYAIAGYSKYISDENIYSDPCTSKMKKKIVFTCVPKSYELNYEKLEKWAFIDIAIVKVESPYDFTDKTYESVCSYIPKPIQVNYEDKFQDVDIDAIALGWGHAIKWRMPNDTNNYNVPDLHYASILIADKEECKKHYMAYSNMSFVIDKYMICSMVEGNINAQGMLKVHSPPSADGCTPKQQKLLGFEGLSCEDGTDQADIVLVENTRKNSINDDNNTIDKVEDIANITEHFRSYNLTNNFAPIDITETRRQGICQNDHGGPIVTWIGSHEVLIGVASVFKVSKEMECIGPFLYTSTQCNGAFLDCLLSSDDNKTELQRRAFCESSPEEKGFETIETHISWLDHPDGPSDNERYLVRPQHIQQNN